MSLIIIPHVKNKAAADACCSALGRPLPSAKIKKRLQSAPESTINLGRLLQEPPAPPTAHCKGGGGAFIVQPEDECHVNSCAPFHVKVKNIKYKNKSLIRPNKSALTRSRAAVTSLESLTWQTWLANLEVKQVINKWWEAPPDSRGAFVCSLTLWREPTAVSSWVSLQQCRYSIWWVSSLVYSN